MAQPRTGVRRSAVIGAFIVSIAFAGGAAAVARFAQAPAASGAPAAVVAEPAAALDTAPAPAEPAATAAPAELPPLIVYAPARTGDDENESEHETGHETGHDQGGD